MNKIKLSTHFDLSEFLDSIEATRLNFTEQFTPPQNIVKNLTRTVQTCLEPAREFFDVPIDISSGYRCERLNKSVNGASTSQHLFGEAVDHGIKSVPDKVKKWFKDNHGFESKNPNYYLFAYYCLNMDKLDIDQVIHEYGTAGNPAWVHVGTSERMNKRQIMIIYLDKSGKQVTEYLSVSQALNLA